MYTSRYDITQSQPHFVMTDHEWKAGDKAVVTEPRGGGLAWLCFGVVQEGCAPNKISIIFYAPTSIHSPTTLTCTFDTAVTAIPELYTWQWDWGVMARRQNKTSHRNTVAKFDPATIYVGDTYY